MRLFPSHDAFVSKLDAFLTRGRHIASTTLANPYYWAGNEPDLLAPWLSAFVPGKQPRTADATRWIATLDPLMEYVDLWAVNLYRAGGFGDWFR